MRLIEFAQGSEQNYRHLQRDIDALPQGKVLLFDCELPPEAVPSSATLGFHRIDSCYAIFIDRDVRYSGDNHAVAALCSGESQSFSSFSGLKRFLKTLPAIPNEPALVVVQDEECDVTPNIAAGALLPPQQAAPAVVDYRAIQREIEKHIVGQEKAVETLAHQVALHLNKSKPRKPLSLIAYGPPGTGKSEAAKALPKVLSHLCTNNYATVWTELNTFTEAHSVYRLTGSPPGYVGYDDAPVFEAVADNPAPFLSLTNWTKRIPKC
jgi:hypothetical protein